MSQRFQLIREAGVTNFRLWGSPESSIEPAFFLGWPQNTFQTTSKIVDFDGPQKPDGPTTDAKGRKIEWD